MLLTREEFLKKIGETEQSLVEKNLEIAYVGIIGYGDDDDNGWEVRFVEPKGNIEVGMGCKCTTGGTLHDKL